MKRASNTLFFSALGASALAHVVLFWLLPYSPLRPQPEPTRRLYPVRLLERTVPAVRPPAPTPARKPRPAAQIPSPVQELPVPAPEPAPIVQEPEIAPQTTVEFPDAVAAAEEPVVQPPAEGPPAAASSLPPADTAVQTEISAYQAILSALRSRIVQDIRYPAIARANGWKGTVLLVARLDAEGRLQETVVRRSSGYEVLDRAAASLLRKVTPVANPLGQPVSIEVPIVYELKD